MPGLFDGLRNSLSGVLVSRRLMDVVSNNIANASNENYSKQEAKLSTSNTVYEGNLSFGQGVEMVKVMRIRDELVDKQIRESSSSFDKFNTQLEWLSKIESLFNEPSENGINSALSAFWGAWSELATEPENLAARSNIMNKAENLTELIRSADEKLSDFITDLDTQASQYISEINNLAKQIAELNLDIFKLEAGKNNQANDLRDQRDAAIEELAKRVDVTVKETANGMVDVRVGMHYLVFQGMSENLILKNDSLDASKKRIIWQEGDNVFDTSGGNINGLLEIRDTVIPEILADLDSFAAGLIEQVNNIYSKGVGMQGETLIESRLGFGAFDGVTNTTTDLDLVSSGENGSIVISFYDDNGEIVRTQGVVIDDDDSLSDVVTKLDGIVGLNASTVSSSSNDGKLRLEFDTISGANALGETSFAVSNNTGGFDSSGILNLLQFDQTEKSTNTSATSPVLTSCDLSELQTALGEPNVTDVMNHVLNLSGTFTINAFETGTESVGKTDGFHVQQLKITVDSSDTINTIMAKINALTAQFGVSISLNASDKLELTSSAQTDVDGNVVIVGGTSNLRLSFANTYQYPAVPADETPSYYNGLGDNTNIFSTMQLNTLFMGSNASDIAIDDRISSGDEIHSSYKLDGGNNSLALDVNALQHRRVSVNNKFTLGEQYQQIISDIGTQVNQADNLVDNENLLLQNLLKSRDEAKGVSLDEELANMILFQRTYEANSRMIRTFDEMLKELLQN